ILGAHPQRAYAVHPHAHADMPADHVGDLQRPLDQPAERVTFGHVLPEPRFRTTRVFAEVLPLDLVDLLVGVRLRRDLGVLLALAGFGPLGADHQTVLRAEQRALIVTEDLAVPLVNCPAGEFADLVTHADERITPENSAVGPQRRPPFPRARRI